MTEWQCMQVLERHAVENSTAMCSQEYVLVPKQVFCRETYLRLEEVSFKHVPSSLQEDLQQFSQAHLSSLAVECLWNDARKKASLNRAGQLNPVSLWHAAVRETRTMEEFDRPNIPITSSGRAAAPPKLPRSVCEGDREGCTLSQDQLDWLCSEKADWANVNGDGVKKSAAAWRLLLHSKGEWEAMANSWLSLLATPGTVILQRDVPGACLVLKVVEHSMLLWRCSVAIAERRQVKFGPLSENSFEFRPVLKLGGWRVAEAELALHAGSPGVASTMALEVRFKSQGTSLMKHAATRGFKNLTQVQLRRLAGHPLVNLTLPKRGDEKQLVEALVRRALGPETTEQQVTEAMHARKHLAFAGDEVLASSHLFSEHMQEVVGEDLEDAEVAEQSEVLKQRRREQQLREKQVRPKVAMPAPSTPASSSSVAVWGAQAKNFCGNPHIRLHSRGGPKMVASPMCNV